ncbi:protein fuzzy homolog [Eurytemora carolleeae]|uniref:protein fuzzy homolog n=1 Tax=Eurytemora carolleeae TaxID=1294199 RepID=UPI000C767B8F|nr:protein fuzzy homolog [Eurytemora carolleeae]|eukprot:XP_023342323.1 protein fuzzy homolog [Eurytemora affinis]
MSTYLICLSINGGLPLFTRKHGDLKSVPFALLASLNGVAMFGSSHDVTLLNTVTRECRIQWRDYHNSIRLIIVVPLDSVGDFHVHRLLDCIFQSLVLFCGLDDLIALRNIDRVKYELRSAFPVIDHLLSGLQPSDKSVLFGDLIGGADVICAQESGALQPYLENYTEAVDSTYGAVFVAGKIVCATSNWWGLHTDELSLLSCFIRTEYPSSLSDTPIFLPVKSPTVPFRLVTCRYR